METQMQIRLPKKLKEQFKTIANNNSQIPSLLVRNWIEEYVAKNKEENKMAKVFYEEILIGEVKTNKSLTVSEALELISFDEEHFLSEQGFDDIDYNDFKLIY